MTLAAQFHQAADAVIAQQDNRQSKTQTAHQIHRQGAHGIGFGFHRLFVADQQEGAKGGDFPEEIEPV